MDQNTVLNIGQLSAKKYGEVFGAILESIRSGKGELYLYGLKGSSREYIAAEIGKALNRQVLYISDDDNGQLGNIVLNLSYYSGFTIPILPRKLMDKKQSLFPTHLEEHVKRMDFLNKSGSSSFLCSDINSVYERFIPAGIMKRYKIELKVGDEINRDDLLISLGKAGYGRSDIVEKPSDYSIRGSVVDLFPLTVSHPFRIEFLGDEIKSIRSFSVESQTSLEKTDSLTITPATEVIFDDEVTAPVADLLHSRALETSVPAKFKNEIIGKISSGERIPNLEWLVPYIYRKPETVFDYLEKNCIIFIDSSVDIGELYESIREHYDSQMSGAGRIEKFIPAFEDLYLSPGDVLDSIRNFQVVRLHDHILNRSSGNSFTFNTKDVSLNQTSGSSPLSALIKCIRDLKEQEYSIRLVTINERENKRLREIINDYSLSGIDLETGSLNSGFISEDQKLAIITENDINNKRRAAPGTAFDSVSSTFIKKFSELKAGDYIVHKECGIGIFRGMKRLKFRDTESDFIECEFQGGDKIFVPVEKLDLIQRYIGENNKPRIDKLGSDTWKKTVKKAKKAVESVARELLELYAKRKVQKGHKFSPRDQIFREFEIGFPFEETEDQARSIEEVISDMESEKPMDRLICGDVGFGKTEVALRAAFKATLDGLQVAFIVPTTLLAHQHYETAVKRLNGYPVNIKSLSRFNTQKEEKDIRSGLENGKVDIVIGTHKLLGNKIKFKNLGLVIIDEEHKFGVKQKEKLRSIKSGLDVLTLSATPIPRTLQFSLADIRDISLINSPPEGRQPVEVSVCNYDNNTIRNAINDELSRGGSVFFIENRIENILGVAEQIRNIVPGATIAVTHGRMNQRLLEKAIDQFINGEIDVLVTTAIVESGLDIARANTIFVKDAHMFGIADLYQLKGRVGRGSVKAYAYFLIPGINTLTPEAKKRLVRISELSDLGSGFKLSLSDLEIRGAGNLFGEEQSGHIANVGLEFYLEMLNKAVSQIKNDGTAPEIDPEIKTSTQLYIPEEFISDSSERLYYYKRISSVTSRKDLAGVRDEIRDRFGNIPDQLNGLFDTVDMKLFLKQFKVSKAEINNESAVLTFSENSPYFGRFAPSGKFRVYYKPSQGYSIIKSRMNQLQPVGK